MCLLSLDESLVAFLFLLGKSETGGKGFHATAACVIKTSPSSKAAGLCLLMDVCSPQLAFSFLGGRRNQILHLNFGASAGDSRYPLRLAWCWSRQRCPYKDEIRHPGHLCFSFRACLQSNIRWREKRTAGPLVPQDSSQSLAVWGAIAGSLVPTSPPWPLLCRRLSPREPFLEPTELLLLWDGPS